MIKDKIFHLIIMIISFVSIQSQAAKVVLTGQVGVIQYTSADVSTPVIDTDKERNLVLALINNTWIYVDRSNDPELANIFFATLVKAKKDTVNITVVYDNSSSTLSVGSTTYYKLAYFQL